MTWRECRARNDGHQCERAYQHEGPHRTETGPPKPDPDGNPIAQIHTWN